MDDRRGYQNSLIFILALLVPGLCIQSRSVNLALETSFLFDPQDIKENATFINKIQTVLDKLKTVLESPAPNYRGKEGIGEDTVILTSFLSDIGSSLIKFDNDELKKITSDLKDAVYKHADKNQEFNEIFEDERLRAFIKNTVSIWAGTDPLVLKVEIAKYLTNVDTDDVIELFRVLNKLFDSSDKPKFKKLKKKFTKSMKYKDYTKFLSKTIDFVIFKRFKKLNFLVTHIIKDELKEFTEYVNKEYKDRTVNTKNDRRFSLSNIARGENIPEARDSGNSNEKTTTETIERRSNKGTLEKEEDIIIDKDVNLNVRTNAQNEITLNVNN